MLPDISSILPGIVTLVLFTVVVRSVLHAVLKPASKIVLVIGVLVLLGIVTPATLSNLIVGTVGFL